MGDINCVTITGRLTRDAELKSTAGGTAVCKFGVAVNRRTKKGDEWANEASFFDVSLWGRQAETLSRYLTKGKQVGVTGELRQERWRRDGQAQSKVAIVASGVQLFGRADGDGRESRPREGFGGDADW